MKRYICSVLLSLFSAGALAQEAAEEEAPISKLPQLIKRVDAIYPTAALRDRIEAVVQLELDIDAAGNVERVGLISSATVAEALSSTTAVMIVRSATITDYGFTRSATTAAGQFAFEPAEAGGKPVPVRIAYTYNFKLPPPPPPPKVARTDTSTGAVEAGPGIVNFSGVVRQSGTRARVPGAVITAFRGKGEEASGFESIADENGNFELVDLTPGRWKILVEATGSFPYRTSEEIKPNEAIEATYYLEKGSYNPYDVMVSAERPKKEVNRRTLKAAEIVKVAGTLGDPIQVVENLPGVARTGGGQLIVRGSGPRDTRVYIDAVEVPLIYHFGGLRSVVPAEIIDSIDFYPGNFSVFYGRGMGGVVDARVKRVAPDQIHGAVDISLLDASLFLEAPITDDLSIAVAGRRSYIDVVLNAVIPEDSSVNLTSAPRYYDYQAIANYRPAEAHDIRLFFFGSNDELEILFGDPADLDAQLTSGSVQNDTSFNRLSALYRYAPSTEFNNDLRFAVGQDKFFLSAFGVFEFDLDILLFQLRDRADWKVSENLTLSAGFDGLFSVTDFFVRATQPPREGDANFQRDLDQTIETFVEGEKSYFLAPFVEAEITLFEKLTFIPGLRLDYTKELEEWTVDPRLVVRYQFDDQWVAKGGVGIVHQNPTEAESDEAFGNINLGTQRAMQYSIGGEWRPAKHLFIDLTFFYKDMQNLVARSSETIEREGETVPELYNNAAIGRVYGLELYARHEFTNNFHGWLTYTLSRAERKDAPDEEMRLFSYDQTHILALIGSYSFRENWEASVRWRLVTGNPYTPYLRGVFVDKYDELTPVSAEVNSDRLPMFHQLDLRIEKKWIFDYWKFAAYFSLTNAYNSGNVEAITYNEWFTETDEVTGLPVLPIIGLRGEF